VPTSVPLAAVLLVGGASRRMGRDKAALPHPGPLPGPERGRPAMTPGMTMLEHAVAVLASCCAPVFVIAAAGQTLPALDAHVLRDEVPGDGPLRATGRGLRAAGAAGLDRAFVCAVDMPYLTADLIETLAGAQEADIVLPSDGRDHYLAAVYRTKLADEIDVLIGAGARSMRALAESVSTRRVVIPAGLALTNVNAESDLG